MDDVSLTLNPVNPSITDQLIDLEYSNINAVNLKKSASAVENKVFL